jgi:hypothetical protein
MLGASKIPELPLKAAVASFADNTGDDPDNAQVAVPPNHDNKPVCTSPASTRPIGLKRAICTDNSRKKKRSCNQSPQKSDNINAAIVQELDPNISIDEANAILHDYNHAVKMLKSQSTTIDPTPSVEYMIRLINEWKPKREIICMYVRWSKRLRRNFHLDSISTLLCVANQCDYTPHVFLKNIKTLTISCSTTTYGLNFKFDTCKNKTIDGNKLNEKFLGLSITLRLLQGGVVSGAGTFGNVGLRTTQKGKDSNNDVTMATDPKQNQKYVVAHRPTSRFHTKGGLLGRIWLAIQHRWISIQIVEMLFPAQLALATTEQESLAFSFQMHSSAGPTRYDFLDPLIGICLRFRTTSIIDNHASILSNVWEKPSSFVAFGNAYLQSTTEKDRIQFVTETFNDLKSTMTSWKKITIHQKTEREVRWQMIRGYAFHFWLESVKNQKIKLAINDQCSASRSKLSLSRRKESTTVTTKLTERFTTKTAPVCTTLVPPKQIKTSFSGLSSLLRTRQVSPSISRTSRPITQPQGEFIQGSHSKTTAPENPTQSINLRSFVWTSIRLASKLEVDTLISSHLLIHRDDGIDVVAELSPLEVYSADMLYKLRHCRWTGPMGFFPKSEVGSVVLTIKADVDIFVDHSSKIYHVAREESKYFSEHGHLIPPIQQITELCKAVVKYGKHDVSRCSQQYRINIGCGGQHRPNGKPKTLVGLSFKTSMGSDADFNAEEIMATIGTLTEFTWNVLRDMQVDAQDGPLAPDRLRHDEYARHLSNYLEINENVGFEDVTIAVGTLYPTMLNVAEHIDSMNDSVAGYTRTGVFNVVLVSEDDVDPVLLHLQILCNFRRVIREYILPFNSSLLSSITNNCKRYLAKWQNNMNQIYSGKTPLVPTPLDRKNFFVDDCLSFESINISSGSQDQPSVTGEYLLTEISPSRVLSFSMFIDPIVDLKEILCYDQRIELCFIASMLSNPFWFEHTITSLTTKHLDPNNPFCFGTHPLNDWAKETTTTFGAWQGGPYNRWSPFGGGTPFPKLFGVQADATNEEQNEGKRKLEAVIQVLYNHLQWVDGLDRNVTDIMNDLPVSMIENHMTSVTEAIFKIVPCQFNVFRLSVFTTIIAGCGEIKHGIHLKALTYPVKGSASFKHLANPNKDHMTREQALSLCHQQNVSNVYDDHNEGIQSQRHDVLMLYLSNEIGMIRYLRDETECVLCEAHPNRNLQCRDWFKKGRRLYDCDIDGNILQREYGINTQWIKMEASRRNKFVFLKEIILYQQIDDVLKDYAMAFGDVLRNNNGYVKFCGRSTRTSDYIQQYSNEYSTDLWKEPFSPIRHRAANFCDGDYIKKMNLTTIQVLGDGEVPVKVDHGCNDITRIPDGQRLWKYVLFTIYGSTDEHRMHSARYHQQESGQDSKTTFFPGHLDKAFVTSAIFLPLTSRDFYTIIAVPKSWYTKQNEESYAQLNNWIQSLPVDEKKMVDEFLKKFLVMAEKFMKINVEMRVFLGTVGSILVFPANICFHTTITPGETSHAKDPRDLFIIHPTTTTKR